MEILKTLHLKLTQKRLSLAVAESCSGGRLASLLTSLPGSSKYFTAGVIAYSKTAKIKFLKIPKSKLDRYGTVSLKTAKLMAENIRKIAGSDIGIGITGYAGPKPGRTQPKGTVYIAVETASKKFSRRYFFKGTRNFIQTKASQKALEILNQLI